MQSHFPATFNPAHVLFRRWGEEFQNGKAKILGIPPFQQLVATMGAICVSSCRIRVPAAKQIFLARSRADVAFAIRHIMDEIDSPPL